ncbi:MAG TPA: LysR family transcriptional regulator [Polyangiaceae bacterium]|jgi:DNA-binding transcriptional LysR family regulator|nr:LysR family transcriptional regulator [Polyangiaceae bacterium]
MHSSWADLRYLESLERLRSARAAGRELGVAASTVYRRIAALEDALALRCLERGRGLTDAGRELARLARSTGASLDEIVRRGRVAKGEVRGKIVLSTIDGFSQLVAEPLGALAREYPLLSVEVHVSEGAGPSIRKRQAEVGLTVVEDVPATLVGRKLFAVQWAVYGAARNTPNPATARWVVLGDPYRTTWLGEWEAKHVPADRVALVTSSRRLLVDLVASGAGLGLLPRRLADDDPRLVEVVFQPKSLPALTRTARLVWHPELRDDARVVALVRALTKSLGS